MNTELTPIAAGTKKFPSLKVAAEDKSIPTVKKETAFQLDPFEIQIRPGFNRPISREHIDTIKDAIRGGAIIPPVDVAVERTSEKSTIFMVDGEHRMWAVRELILEFRQGLSSGRDIAFISAIEFKGDLGAQIAHMLGSANKLAIEPLVQGEKYELLLALKWDVPRIAQHVGKSKTHVENCLLLARANPDVKESLRTGEVTGSTAVKVLRTHGSDAGKVIKGALAATGKGKVTAKAFSGPAVPKKLVSRFTSGLGSLFEALPELSAEALAEKPEGATVEVPAAVLAELRAAHDEMQKVRAKAEAKAAKAAEAAAKAAEQGNDPEATDATDASTV